MMPATTQLMSLEEVQLEEDRLSNHPATLRLAAIFADARRLAEEIRSCLGDHPPRCRCLCCVEIREREHWFGPPDLRDHMTAAFTALMSMQQLCHEQRPDSAAEIQARDESMRNEFIQNMENRKPNKKGGA